MHEPNETRVVSHVDDPFTCAKTCDFRQILEKHCEVGGYQERKGSQSTHICGVLRGLNAVLFKNPDLVQLQNAKPLVTPLTEQKNAHDETNMCDQVQHVVSKAFVGKLQHITRVRPDLLFVTKCLSYKLASPTLAVLTSAKKALRCLKGTRYLNLYLTIHATKFSDLSRLLKNITGYSDADWAGDPMTRKSTSCTLCSVEKFLMTSECKVLWVLVS